MKKLTLLFFTILFLFNINLVAQSSETYSRAEILQAISNAGDEVLLKVENNKITFEAALDQDFLTAYSQNSTNELNKTYISVEKDVLLQAVNSLTGTEFILLLEGDNLSIDDGFTTFNFATKPCPPNCG